jgi:Flp pilus assembly pilin Flp
VTIRLTKLYVAEAERMRRARRAKGQTMTEYALILAAIAIVTYLTYQVMGQDIGSMACSVEAVLEGS